MKLLKVDALGCSVAGCKSIFTQPSSTLKVGEEALKFGWVFPIVDVGDGQTARAPEQLAICSACREKIFKHTVYR